MRKTIQEECLKPEKLEGNVYRIESTVTHAQRSYQIFFGRGLPGPLQDARHHGHHISADLPRTFFSNTIAGRIELHVLTCSERTSNGICFSSVPQLHGKR